MRRQYLQNHLRVTEFLFDLVLSTEGKCCRDASLGSQCWDTLMALVCFFFLFSPLSP